MPQVITIAGKPYNVEPRYAEGHVINANEASALNQTLFENLRNNFAAKAKEGADQAAFDSYAASYQFGVRVGGRSSDPVETEALNVAREQVKTAIQNAGKKLSDYSAATITKAAEGLLAKPDKGPEIREIARQRVQIMQQNVATEVDSDLLSMIESAKAEQASSDSAPTTGDTSSTDQSGETTGETAPATGRKARG